MMAKKRRRPVVRWFFRILGLLALAFVLVSAFHMIWPPPLPTTQVATARSALRAAHAAPPLAVNELAQADKISWLMERHFAQERAKLVRYSRNRELEAEVQSLLEAARAAEQVARERHITGLEESRLRYRELASRLAAMRGNVASVPGERKLQRSYRNAEMALDQVRELQRLEKLDSLPGALTTAESAVGRAEELVGSHFARLHDPKLRSLWKRLVDETVAGTRGGGMAIIVDKLNRRCVVVKNGRKTSEYPADFGRKGLLDKVHSGDGATPEGRYHVTKKNAGSRYYRALLINYPNAEDQARYASAKRNGQVPNGRGPGGLIEIHGNGGRDIDWTDGCIALRDNDMEKLFRMAGVGTPVTIVGAARLPGD